MIGCCWSASIASSSKWNIAFRCNFGYCDKICHKWCAFLCPCVKISHNLFFFQIIYIDMFGRLYYNIMQNDQHNPRYSKRRTRMNGKIATKTQKIREQTINYNKCLLNSHDWYTRAAITFIYKCIRSIKAILNITLAIVNVDIIHAKWEISLRNPKMYFRFPRRKDKLIYRVLSRAKGFRITPMCFGNN